MGRWRTKVLHSLILFSAGFATAIYVLAPPPPDGDDGTPALATAPRSHAGAEHPGSGTQDRAAMMRAGIDRTVSFAEENAVKFVQAAKQQLDQWRQQQTQ